MLQRFVCTEAFKIFSVEHERWSRFNSGISRLSHVPQNNVGCIIRFETLLKDRQVQIERFRLALKLLFTQFRDIEQAISVIPESFLASGTFCCHRGREGSPMARKGQILVHNLQRSAILFGSSLNRFVRSSTVRTLEIRVDDQYCRRVLCSNDVSGDSCRSSSEARFVLPDLNFGFATQFGHSRSKRNHLSLSFDLELQESSGFSFVYNPERPAGLEILALDIYHLNFDRRWNKTSQQLIECRSSTLRFKLEHCPRNQSLKTCLFQRIETFSKRSHFQREKCFYISRPDLFAAGNDGQNGVFCLQRTFPLRLNIGN